MPPLLQSAQLKPDVTISSADSDNELDDSDDDRLDFLNEVCLIHFIMKFFADLSSAQLAVFVILNFYVLKKILGKKYKFGKTFGTAFEKRKITIVFPLLLNN